MIIISFLFSYLVINPIGSGSQSDGDVPDDPRSNQWNFSSRQIPHYSGQNDQSLSARSGSPLVRPPSASIAPATPVSRVLGYGLGQLGLIRLIPNNNPYRTFEFRKYTFDPSARLRRPAGKHVFSHLPTSEQIVLTTSTGDIFAILDTSGSLTGIYSTLTGRPRVKLNMESSQITTLTLDEIRDCPVGARRLLNLDYSTVVVNHDSLLL